MFSMSELVPLIEPYRPNQKINTKIPPSENDPVVIKKYDCTLNNQSYEHDFFEIKYVYSGEATFLINEKRVAVKEGQMILLEKGCVQEFRGMTETDLVIGFLFEESAYSIRSLRKMGKDENFLVYNFLNEYFLKTGLEDEALMIDLRKNTALDELLKTLVYEVFQVTKNSELIESLVQVFFYKLVQVYYSDLPAIYRKQEMNWTMLTVLKKIETEYPSLSLAQLSEELGYNMNYLSNLIKDKTGKSFKSLISEMRVKKAYDLIVKTNLPINRIAFSVGYTNRSYFYMKFEEYFGNSPMFFRKEAAV